MSRNVRRGDSFSFSSSSGVSRNSSDRGRKPPRFSLRRLFCRRPTSARSVRTVHSQSEIESQSVSSLQASVVDRESSSKGNSTDGSHVVYKKTKDGLECPVCMTFQPKENFPMVMTCHHRSCRYCLKMYLRIEITESRINIACPECNEKFHPNDIKAILEDDDLMLKYEEFMLRRVLVLDPDTRWCPAPDCGYAVIATRCASCPRIRCEAPGCNTLFCYHCKQHWHPNQTCDAARAERTSNLRSSSISYSNESGTQNEIKPCPRCGAFIVKMDDGSCNHMTCAVCGAEFCWLCMKEISDLHYLSPSGCTFWGKKPWSRKKKILWQLGILVGAPVGITLIAGIAVPAIIIGVPVWVGRRLHSRYDYMTKHKRNSVMAGGIIASILVSPILAGLAVGIGVPILLAYVYGVVPISLCRSGGCGVTTTNSGGVRFDFDDDGEAPAGPSTSVPGAEAQGLDNNGHQIANPSIGPSIGEMSMVMTNSLSASGSHLDRVGALRDDLDRDSASNRAIAGASISGSVSSGTVAATTGYHNRLEIHADVNSHSTLKRSSISSESANLSLDAKSATASYGDDASTKALAGSLCYRDREENPVVPASEMQMDAMTASAQYHTGAEPVTHKMSSGHGSPTSSRSVNFLGEEILGATGSSGGVRRFTRHSVSIGNSICENGEQRETSPCSSSSFADNLSVGTSSQDCDSLFAHGRSRASSVEPGISTGSQVSDGMARHMTEVENDRPISGAHQERAPVATTTTDTESAGDVVSSSADSTSTAIASVIHRNHAAGDKTVETNKDTGSSSSQSRGAETLSIEAASITTSSSSSIASGVCETTMLIDGVSTSSSSS